ncbi:MAG: hypothetical protein HY064_00090 [Bacteroidetes bacterium]|nr:hypothetical protein [Bacteroidota bacterium]
MPRAFFLLIPFFIFLLADCRGEKICSGLNPELATYNTTKRLRKGGRSLHSEPEREAHRHRMKTMKKKSKTKSTGAYSGHGFFHLNLHLFGGHAHASGQANVRAKS